MQSSHTEIFKKKKGGKQKTNQDSEEDPAQEDWILPVLFISLPDGCRRHEKAVNKSESHAVGENKEDKKRRRSYGMQLLVRDKMPLHSS